jgi:nitrite reductase/ring-hydroxylating ferredoxin subunit
MGTDRSVHWRRCVERLCAGVWRLGTEWSVPILRAFAARVGAAFLEQRGLGRGTKTNMAFVKVGSLAALPPGSVMEAEVGEGTYAICNVGGELSALDGICPHAGGPLGQGNVDGDKVVCPWHEWAYSCRTGVNDYDENVKLAMFPVKVDGDDILIDVP